MTTKSVLTRGVWRKSSHTGSSCVEAMITAAGDIAVRNSRHPDGSVLVYRPDEWTAFIAGAKEGEFDL